MAPPTGPDGRTLQKGNTVGGASIGGASPRNSYSGRPLTNRCNKSCDWLGPPGSRLAVGIGGGAQTPVEDNFRSNPIAQVSSDILRAQGYTQQFKSLLSSGTRARRDSVPGSSSEAVAAAAAKARGAISQQQSLEERCNGDLLSSLTPGGSSGLAIGGGPQTAVPTPATKSLEWNLGVEDGCGGSPSRKDQQHQILRRRQSGYGISITTESQAKMRCKLRKLYFLKRNKICDLSLALAVIGLAFVVLEQELTALEIVSKRSAPSLMLRSACVASTLMLIASLINYHRTEVKIALIDSGAEDWRVALTTDRVIKLMIEICVCAVCPFPGSGTIAWPYISADERRMTLVSVPLDVLLSVPMFLRAYLLCRFMVLHSRQFQDAATRSIAALNRISMDFRFVIKTMMADHPMTVLVVFTCCYWICMSWMFTQCERYNGRYAGTEYYYMNSLWFIMVTFMSIGYGDVVPTSYCGRFLSITTGIVGAGVSSALIAVISRKLELSRAEKHVNNFMADSKLTNARKNAAASVLQHTWFIHRYQQRNGHKGDDLRLRQHQRKFLNAINDFRRIKWDQRKLQEKGNSLLDVGKLHTEMHETLWEMHRTQDHFASMIEVLTQRIAELQQTVLAATQLQPMAAAPAAAGGLPNIPIQQQLLTPMSAANTNTSSTTTTTTNPPSLSSPIPNYYNSNCTNNNSGVGGGGRMAPTRKTSMSAQLRVPNNGDYVTPPPHPPIRKYSAVHPPPHYHQNPAPAPHHPTTAVPYQYQQQQHPLGHAHSQQNNNNSSSRISINACANAVQMPVILDGFGPSPADELAAPALTNSRSSPCLQKSQQQQNHQQQQTLGRTMRVLQQQAEQEEDECRPLMGCADEMA